MSISPLGLLFLPHIRHFLNNLVMEKIYRQSSGSDGENEFMFPIKTF